jgi:hypothetical protein
MIVSLEQIITMIQMFSYRSPYEKPFVDACAVSVKLDPDDVDTLMYKIYEGKVPDIWLIEHPRCGRTWLLSMLGKSLCDALGIDDSLFNSEPRVLMCALHFLKQCPVKVLEYDHDETDTDLSYSDLYKRDQRFLCGGKVHLMDQEGDLQIKKQEVIFMVRDIRDVLVSWFYARKLTDDIGAFIRDDRYGLRKILSFWNLWYERKDRVKEFHLFSYEDLHDRTGLMLAELLRILGVPHTPRSILDAVEFASFKNMQKMEKEGKWSSWQIKDHVREGRIGGHKDHLNKEQIDWIDRTVDYVGCPFAGTAYKEDWRERLHYG